MNNRLPQTGEERSARWLVWGLVVICIGVPVVVELTTLSGLITNQLSRKKSTPTDSSAVVAPVVRVGTPLLPETPLRATLTEAGIIAGAQRWTLALELRVRNGGAAAYELRLGPVETKSGAVIPDTTTKRWAGGGGGMLRAEWPLPPGEEPVFLTVQARRLGTADSSAARERQRLRLGKVPVRAGRR